MIIHLHRGAPRQRDPWRIRPGDDLGVGWALGAGRATGWQHGATLTSADGIGRAIGRGCVQAVVPLRSTPLHKSRPFASSTGCVASAPFPVGR